MSQIYVLYHASCHDGFSAAYAAWKKFGDNARYIAMNDRVNYPEFIPEGSEVYLLDFSFKREIIDRLRPKMSRLVILDHHVTIQKDLEGQPDTVFDMTKSGCVIAWEYFHTSSVPLFLRYIEDRDIFRNALPFTREVTMYNFSLAFDFLVWDENVRLFREIENTGGIGENSFPVSAGRVILGYQKILINNMIDRLLQWKVIGGHKVPVVNTPREFGTEICVELLEQHPSALFSGYFYETKKGIEWGLRSRDFDVSEIARALGGGGHRQAAGFIRMSKTEDTIDLPKEA